MDRKVNFLLVVTGIVVFFVFFSPREPSVGTSTTLKSTAMRQSNKSVATQNKLEASELSTQEQELSDHANLSHKDKVNYSMQLSAEVRANQKLTRQQIDYLKKTIRPYIERLRAYAKAGDWDAFNGIVNVIELTAETLDIMLSIAIRANAPYEEIAHLINLGASLKDRHFITLLMTNNIELVKQLIAHGLNIHARSAYGGNAISYVLKTINSLSGSGGTTISLKPVNTPAMNEQRARTKEMFDFFLAQGVSVKPSPLGLDPLDLALAGALRADEGIYYVDKLVQQGAPIEKSHRDLVARLATDNPQRYSSLVQQVPELAR